MVSKLFLRDNEPGGYWRWRLPHRGQQVPSGVDLAYHGKRPTNKQYINCLIHRLNFRIYSLEQMQWKIYHAYMEYDRGAG